MKDRKYLLFVLPVLVFLGTFLVIKVLDNRSYAIITSDNTSEQPAIPEGTVYKMIRKNTYSWHLITHNFNSFSSTNASGTKLLETKNAINGTKYKAVTYCATEGKTLSQSSKRTRYSIDSSKVTKLNATKKATLKAVMPYMYPYINLGKTSADANTLKSVLKSSTLGLNGNDYDTYQFDKLNVNEAITGVQAAIWNIQKGKTEYYKYRGTISSFSAFNSCAEYHNNKMLTSEEIGWWNETDCKNKTGDFYNYVVSHKTDGNTKNRIEKLTYWYTNILQGKINSSGGNQDEYFKTVSSNYSNLGVLNVTFDTNIATYDIVFKDQNGNVIQSTNNSNGNSFTINGLDSSVKQVNISVTSTGEPKSNVFYYLASSGQDFIGVEKTYYTRNETLSVTRDADETAKIIIYKVGGKNINVQVTDNGSKNFDVNRCDGEAIKCLSDAKFELYYQNKNNLVKVIETDYENINSVMFDNLPLGTYYLKETQPAYGYDLYNYNVGTEGTDGYVDSDGYITINLTGDGAGTSTQTKAVVVNNNFTRLCISKVSANEPNKILSGATFEVEDIDGNVIVEFDTSSQEGSKCFDGLLQSGSYFLKEKAAPTGFSIDPNRYHFIVGKAENDISTLDDIGAYKDVTVTNNTITLINKEGLRMSKSDLSDAQCVEGATLTIKNKDTDETVFSWISTCIKEDGTGEDSHTVPICLNDDEEQSYGETKCLRPGKYTLTEEIHPEGYATAESTDFEIDNNGKITCGTDENGNERSCGEMKDAPIEVCIYKVKKGTKEVLPGAEFEIYKKGENTRFLNHPIVSSKEPCIKYSIPVGEYVIKETKAPDGYALPKNNETTIVVEDKAGHQDFYIENEAIAPKTAMDYSVTVVIIASVFMMFGIGLVGYYEYKKGH